MKARVVKSFWKIRDKKTKLFVVKSHRSYYGYYRDKEYAARAQAAEEAKPNYSPYAILGTVGKSYSTKSGAMSMMSTLASLIQGRDVFDKTKKGEDSLKVCEPYYELVEYEVREIVHTEKGESNIANT